MSTFIYFVYIIIGLLIVPYQVLCGGMVRFRDGYSSADGRVEVKADEDSEWGNICSDEFDILDADVICRQLDYAWALYMYDVSDTLGDRDVVLWDLDCDGSEENVYDCEHEQEPPPSGCLQVGGVGIECIAIDKSEFDPYKELRLSGDNDISGNLQIKDDGDWRPICSDGWDIEDAVVACRQLGFISAVDFDTYILDYQTGIYMDFDCDYVQGYLLACEHRRGGCSEFVSIECAGEFEDYLPDSSYNFSEYYEWQHYNPCNELDCHNGGHCYILYEYFEPVCDCPPQWEGEQCLIPVNDNSGEEVSTTQHQSEFSVPTTYVNPDGNGEGNGGPAPTDAPGQSTSDDVIIYVAIGAGVFVLLVAVIVTISVAMIMRRRNTRRAKAKAPAVELDLKGKPIQDNKRNNNSYQGLARPGKPANIKPKSKPTSGPSSDYYLEPSPDYVSRQQPVDDYTALASPDSELYDEIPYDSIDNGGYMGLQNPSSPSDYQPPPELPKPR